MAAATESSPAVLEVVGTDREFAIEGHEMRMGRGPDCDVRIDDPTNTISGLHAVVRRGPDGFVLIDESRNGTSVRRRGKGRPVALGREPHSLVDGDVVVLMEGVEIRFHDAAASNPSNSGSATRKEKKGGNRGFLVAGALMWTLVLGALALGGGDGDESDPNAASRVDLTALVAAIEGDGSSATNTALRELADHVRADASGWLRENVLAAAWAERSGDVERAQNIWGQVYLRARAPETAHAGLARFARERLDDLK